MSVSRIDHALVAVRDLDAAARRFMDDFGLDAQAGGTHSDTGTANRIVPVGNDQYVELLGVVDSSVAHPMATWLQSVTAGGDRVIGVCIEPDDFAAAEARTAETAFPLTRAHEDGRVVHFRIVGMGGALGPHRLPFFIEWGKGREWRCGFGTSHHRVEPAGIRQVVFSGDEGRAREWIGDDSLPIVYRAGDEGVVEVTIGVAAAGARDIVLH